MRHRFHAFHDTDNDHQVVTRIARRLIFSTNPEQGYSDFKNNWLKSCSALIRPSSVNQTDLFLLMGLSM